MTEYYSCLKIQQIHTSNESSPVYISLYLLICIMVVNWKLVLTMNEKCLVIDSTLYIWLHWQAPPDSVPYVTALQNRKTVYSFTENKDSLTQQVNFDCILLVFLTLVLAFSSIIYSHLVAIKVINTPCCSLRHAPLHCYCCWLLLSVYVSSTEDLWWCGVGVFPQGTTSRWT